jgi:chemotaxis protein histidine kinase CheA
MPLSSNLNELLGTFIEETLENLSDIEESLLIFNLKDPDPELINRVFRAIHTIKGNSVIFKLTPISELMHAIESLLAEIRIGVKNLESNHIELIFQSTDLIRFSLSQLQRKEPLDKVKIKNLTLLFKAEIDIHKDTATKIDPFNQPIDKESKERNSLPKTSTIRIPTKKIDVLMNSICELLITKSILNQKIKALDRKSMSFLEDILETLEKNTLALRDDILHIRLVPIGFAINRFPRMVFDIAQTLGKEIDFIIKGEQTEIDKTMIEKLTDPILHLIRNSIDHGIEFPDTRINKGKHKIGTLAFNAYQEEKHIIVEITDDGCGINPTTIREIAISKGLISPDKSLSLAETYDLLFKPGFSTKDSITETSGRGVGLDVVKKSIQALGGSIDLISTINIGTIFKLKLPLTMVIMNCQTIQMGTEIYNIPLLPIIGMFVLDTTKIGKINNDFSYHFKNEYIPLIQLEKILNIRSSKKPFNQKIIIIIQTNEKYYALLCDELLTQQPVVIKTLDDNYCKVPGIVGATIMGDGNIALILDINDITHIVESENTHLVQQRYTSSFFRDPLLFSSRADHPSPDSVTTPTKEPILTTTPYDLLCFSIDNNEFAININSISDILLWKNITPLPFSAPYLLGLLNHRGNLIPLIDLGNYFDLHKPLLLASVNIKSFILVITLSVNNTIKKIGILADSINDTHRVCKEDIHPISKIGYLTLAHYIEGLIHIKGKIITILKLSHIFTNGSRGNI